jgi:hypothetical protein
MILRAILAIAWLLVWPSLPQVKRDEPDKQGYPSIPKLRTECEADDLTPSKYICWEASEIELALHDRQENLQ